MTLSLADMASRVQLSGPQEAEQYILHMVKILTFRQQKCWESIIRIIFVDRRSGNLCNDQSKRWHGYFS